MGPACPSSGRSQGQTDDQGLAWRRSGETSPLLEICLFLQRKACRKRSVGMRPSGHPEKPASAEASGSLSFFTMAVFFIYVSSWGV